MLSRVQIGRLVRHLQQQIHNAEELGCTCADRTTKAGRNGHQTNCSGVNITREARAYLTRLKGKGLI